MRILALFAERVSLLNAETMLLVGYDEREGLELPVYIVGYRYTNGIDDNLTYAYKISVDDNQSCNILEEGEDTAAFLFE